MAFFQGLSLLLLLAYASSGLCKTSRELRPPHHRHQPHHRRSSTEHHHHHHDHHPLQRQARALSEFLVPPPAPVNYRGPRGPPHLPSEAQGKHARNGRYINQQAGPNSVPGYFSKLANWLNPFESGVLDAPLIHQQQLPQYAPQQPYTSATAPQLHYHQPPPAPPLASPSQPVSGYPSLASWMSGKSCNPCNDVPWTPILHQYAPNAGSNAYLPPPAPTLRDPTQTPDYPHQPAPGYPGISPPLYDAKPFDDTAPSYHLSNSPQVYETSSPSPVYNHQASAELDSHHYDDHQSTDFDGSQQQPSSFDYHSSYDVTAQRSSPNPDHHHQEPDHAESRPVHVNSPTNSEAGTSTTTHDLLATATTPGTPRRQPSYQNVYFQRSPLIDLSVAGESTTTTTTGPSAVVTTPSYRGEKRYRPVTMVGSGESTSPPPPATVIDYIVSGPDEVLDSNEVERETRPPRLFIKQQQNSLERIVVGPSTKTKDPGMDQKGKKVPSYEFDRRGNGTRTASAERLGRPYNETEDYSASREDVVPNKDSGKKNKQIIQIIIPYTSQYTPSPFHPTKSVDKHRKKDNRGPPKPRDLDETTSSSEYLNTVESDEDNAVIEESRRVPVTRSPPPQPSQSLRNASGDVPLAGKMGNTIDVHRLQKNIDNWTIQEYSKSTKSIANSLNSTNPRWLSSKQIPDEYLLSTAGLEETSGEYYDFSNETKVRHRGTDKLQSTQSPETVTKVDIINATYPRKPDPSRRRQSPSSRSRSASKGDSERVYVVTPIPSPNSLEDSSSHEKGSRRPQQIKEHLETAASSSSREDTSSSAQVYERAYQVLPQAVNNLAVLSHSPESSAPALWGIMEHEEFAASADQPRWRSEADVLPEPASTPVLYAGHSKRDDAGQLEIPEVTQDGKSRGVTYLPHPHG
ncbi:putative DNA helicase INO80 [Copidosoma floridanum]|uniref:putative DNA helicase INO80 n=1 Tax=Copidosoma floridanum TaxID=29053 RepID=UPI0006C9BB9B|nr:putative DNA helicase INO80 [Copidosoma floridanum]